jgi:hypothetical protein
MVWAVKVALRRTRQLLMDGGYVYRNDCVYIEGSAKELFESVLDDILKKAAKEDDDLLQEAGQVGHVAHAHVFC